MDTSIEILYEENCPNYTQACAMVCDIIAELEINATINITKIENQHEKFRGSPTILVNGRDVEMCYNEMTDGDTLAELVKTGACRLYDCDHGRGCPSHDMIRCSLETVITKN